MRGFTWLKRLVGSDACPDPTSPECKRKLEQHQREADAEFRRQEREYLTRMEDEIAVLMRERENGH